MPTVRRNTRPRRFAVAIAFAAASALASGVASAAPPPPSDTGWHVGTPSLSTPWTDEVSPTNALPEYPRPQLTRPAWQNLNGVWEFAGAAAGEAAPVGETLDERVLVPYPIESALSGIQRHEDRMWYRRAFTVPQDWKVGRGQRLMLRFGAVDYDAKVWVNGTQVATHRGGYDGFDVDVTDALRPRGQQELIVGAEDLTDATFQPIGKQRRTPDRGIFYQGSSGIWRTVWMEPVAAAHITDLDMVPDLDTSTLSLTPHVFGQTAGRRVEAVAYDGNRIVGSITGPAGSLLALKVRGMKSWSPDSPFLYDLRVRLLNGTRPVDEVGSYFGMREIGKAKGADGKLRMTLNGKILFHMSTLDQGFWPDGLNTAPTDAALRFDLEQHKLLGFNTVRKHIKVEPDRWYYHADKLGLMVWQDMPATKTEAIPEGPWRAQFESELHEMVREHDAFTSIVIWVPFNEGWGEWDRTATGRIANDVKAQDPSRLVNAHSGVNCCNSRGDSGQGDIIDHHQYIGPASPVPTEDRAAVDGEHGGLGLKVPGHMWFGDGFAYEMTPDKATLTRRYVEVQRDVLKVANTCGISGAVYTQITDVEAELNGFFTYDRQVQKMDFAQVRAVNRAVIRSADGTGSGTPQPRPGTPGLNGVGAWTVDEGSGTVARDSADGHDATLVNGAGWTSGMTGSAVALNGTDQYVDANASILDTTSSYSAAAWVKLNAAGEAFQTVVSQDGAGDSAFFLQYSGADKRFAFSFVGTRALAPTAPVPGQWYHLVGVRDAAKGTLQLYVDGALADTKGACLGEASTGNTVIGRGKYGGNPVDYLNGAVDQVHVFDRALSATEVRDLYLSGN